MQTTFATDEEHMKMIDSYILKIKILILKLYLKIKS